MSVTFRLVVFFVILMFKKGGVGKGREGSAEDRSQYRGILLNKKEELEPGLHAPCPPTDSQSCTWSYTYD